MPVTPLVRKADINDAAAIAAISRKTFYDTFAGQNTPDNMRRFMDEQFTEAQLVAEVGMTGNIFLVAIDEGEIAGYAFLRHIVNPPELGSTPAIELARIYSQQAMMGRGIGKALMQRCIAVAAGLGKKVLWLGVWEHNRRAIDFYIKWGFEQFSSHDFVLGADVQRDWLMKREIS